MHKYFGDIHTLEKKIGPYDYMTKRTVQNPKDLESQMHKCLKGYIWNGTNFCRFGKKEPVTIEAIVLPDGKDHFLPHGLRSMVFSYEGKQYKVFMYNFDKVNSGLNGKPEKIRLQGKLVGALSIPDITPYKRRYPLCPVLIAEEITPY
jgi:hypothetical protein